MTEPARCTGEPVSWLRLERFHAGALAGDERERVARHLAECAACAACLAKIRDDEAVALPPLALPAAAKRARVAPPPLRARVVVPIAGALAAAAALLVLVRGKPVEPIASRVKGGDVAFTLVREDGARVEGDSGAYRDGDRFMAVVTCPPGGDMSFDVVVYDDAGASFPLEPAPRFACGNEAPLPGAMRLTGRGEETVCLLWSDDEGVALRAAPERASGRVCKALRPVDTP